MVQFWLRICDAFSGLIRSLGADYGQFRSILEMKLTLDNRRQASGIQNRNKEQDKIGKAFVIAMVVYAFMGALLGSILFSGAPLFVSMLIIHIAILCFVGMSLVADFSNVLLDTTDLSVIGPRPVSGRTLLVARIVHICIYLGSLGLSFSAGTLVFGAIKFGLFFPAIFLVSLVCLLLFLIFAVNLFYLIAMRFTDIEKFRDIVLYFQMGMSFLIMAGYQIFPRVVNLKKLQDIDLVQANWVYFFPPAWFAAPMELTFQDSSPKVWVLAAIGLLIPVIGMWFVVRYLAPNFGKELSMLRNTESVGSKAETSKSRKDYRTGIGSLFTKKGEERVAFDLTWILSSRDRAFKLRVYPSLAFFLIFPLVISWRNFGEHDEMIQQFSDMGTFLLAFYMSSFFLPSIVANIAYSPEYEAAWPYYCLPVEAPGRVVLGSIKAVFCRFGLPVFAVLSAMFFVFRGADILPHLILGTLFTWIAMLITTSLLFLRFPFSENLTVGQTSGQFGKNLVLLLIPGFFALIHFVLTLLPYGVEAGIPVAAFFAWWIPKRYDQYGWEKFGVRTSVQALSK